MKLKECIMDLAASKKVTPAQLSLAWILAQKDFIVPIPGTSKLSRMEENIKAADVEFTPYELKNIRELLDKIPIYGERYDPDTDNAKSVRQ